MYNCNQDILIDKTLNPCTCNKCGKSTDKSLLMNINRIRASVGKCHGSRNCNANSTKKCKNCRINLCQSCSSMHSEKGHEVVPPELEFISCTKHPSMAAKFLCNCQAVS